VGTLFETVYVTTSSTIHAILPPLTRY